MLPLVVLWTFPVVVIAGAEHKGRSAMATEPNARMKATKSG
jgi:hypothetical protein